jgi:hypothetical protein
MHYKIKNTLAGLAVAMSMVGVSYSVGQAPTQSTVQVDYKQPGVEVQLDELQAARLRLRGMRSQMSMPFYSFAPLLPRREG